MENTKTRRPLLRSVPASGEDEGISEGTKAMTNPKSDRAALDRLADALAEDILNASDQDILDEVKEEDGKDPAAIAKEVKTVFAKAKAKVAKRQRAYVLDGE